MRARFFRALLRRWERHTPETVRRAQLQILMGVTARAFRAPGQRLWTRPWGDGLRAYAEYTRAHSRDADVDPERLYALAYALGIKIRRVTGFRDAADLERLVFWLYQGIGIAMSGTLPGEIAVSGCYFSAFYAPEQCALMSHMDSGIVGGIMGGGKLRFTERLTEGSRRCRACLRREEITHEGQ